MAVKNSSAVFDGYLQETQTGQGQQARLEVAGDRHV